MSPTLGCEISATTISPRVYDLTLATCDSNTEGDIRLDLRANSTKNLIGISGPASTVSSQLMRLDNKAPTASVISKLISGNTLMYQLQFSEEVTGFNASSLVFSKSLGTDWTISTIVRQPNTNIYVFNLAVPQISNGNLSFTLSPGVTDLAGNHFSNTGLAASSEVSIEFLPTFDPGPSRTLAIAPTKIAPDFELNSRGRGIAGLQIRITNSQPGDGLGFSNQSGITGTLTASNSVLTLVGATSIADSTWETAIRSITFSS